jgi:MFS family permease
VRLEPVVAGSAVGFAAGWNIADVGAAAKGLADAYGVGLTVIGLFTTSLFLTHLLMQLPAGRLSDRLGAHRVCALGLVVLAACNAAALVAPEPAIALAARTAMGVGTALAFIGGSDYVRATGGSPFAQGLYGGVATAGGGVALAVVPLTTGLLDWRAPFVTGIVIAVAAGPLLAAGPRVTPALARHGERVPLMAMASDERVLRLAVVFAGSFGLSIVIANWVVTLLEDTAGIDSGTAGAIGAATLVLGIVSRPAGGWILRSHPRAIRRAVFASAVGGALGTVLLCLGSPALAVLGAIAVGLSAGIPFAAAFGGAAMLHPGSPAAAVGLVNAAGALTVLVGTPLAGIAFQHDAGVAAFASIAVLWLASALALGRSGPVRPPAPAG